MGNDETEVAIWRIQRRYIERLRLSGPIMCAKDDVRALLIAAGVDPDELPEVSYSDGYQPSGRGGVNSDE